MSVTITVYDYDVPCYDKDGERIPDCKVFHVRWKSREDYVIVQRYSSLTMPQILGQLQSKIFSLTSRPNSEVKWKVEK